MKRKINYITAGFAVLLLSLMSCEDFMDIHEEYIKGGEIIYAPKPDTVSFISGKERIKFNCRIYNALNIESVDIYWNSGLDSLIIPVSMSTGFDSLSCIMNNMKEQSYTFYVQTTDKFGNKSLKVSGIGSSYGDSYISTLTDRRIKKISIDNGKTTMEWYSPRKDLIGNEVRYTTTDGKTSIVYIPSDQYVIDIPDPKFGSDFEYRSLYIPEAECIDTFATKWLNGLNFPDIVKYDRSNWKVLEVSDETAKDGGGKDALIDENLNSYWHSQWDGGNAPLPHWAIIDMGTDLEPRNFDIYRRKGRNHSKTVELYISDQADANGVWTKIATGKFTGGDKLEIKVPDETVQKGRYLKMILPDSYEPPFTSIAEIYAYGKYKK